jgi:hypothetical protein
MPPADVVLAAAKAVGISLDDRLGIGREPSDEERRLADLRELLSRQDDRAAAFEERLEHLAQAVSTVRASLGQEEVERRLAKIEVQVMEIRDDLAERERHREPRRQRGTRAKEA